MRLTLLQTARAVPLALCLMFGLLVWPAHGHEHHDGAFEGGVGITDEPIGSILWIHILIQTFAWGILFPTGMVLGMIKSRWHVPVQILGTVLAVVGYFLGHGHNGRNFAVNAHEKYAPILNFLLAIQVILGIYLKLHLERGIYGRIRWLVVKIHGIVGKALPVAAWVQLLFGGITTLGFCREDHLGQCLAHFIMGSAFIAYGIVLTILLLVGQAWLRRTGKSQEFFDSVVIAAWGCVNTFTEHRWGTAWVHNDLQHTTMGIIWWCAGLLGMWLSRGRGGEPKRNLIPALVILLTGYAMSSHPQTLMISSNVHSIFGYTLMSAAIVRIVEISFLLKDKATVSEDGTNPNSFQYLPPFLLCAGGFLFMGATEEQMKLLNDSQVDHVTYILILYSVSFLLFLFVNILLHIYAVNAFPTPIKDPEAPSTNGHLTNDTNGNRLARDAEEFELEGLTSEDEGEMDEEERLLREQGKETASQTVQ